MTLVRNIEGCAANVAFAASRAHAAVQKISLLSKGVELSPFSSDDAHELKPMREYLALAWLGANGLSMPGDAVEQISVEGIESALAPATLDQKLDALTVIECCVPQDRSFEELIPMAASTVHALEAGDFSNLTEPQGYFAVHGLEEFLTRIEHASDFFES